MAAWLFRIAKRFLFYRIITFMEEITVLLARHSFRATAGPLDDGGKTSD
jgi:hypothetical protein